MCSENNQLANLCRKDIISAAETMVKLECKYIDKMFEMGDIEGIKANDLKHFIKKRANEKLVELGYTDLASHFAFNVVAAANLDWFYHLTGGVTHTSIILPAGSLILIFSRFGRRTIRKLVKAKTSKTFGNLITEQDIYEDLYDKT
jgi:hypothetical protein